MRALQKEILGCDRGPGNYRNANPSRLLEDSDGVTRLYFSDAVHGTVGGAPTYYLCEEGTMAWREIHVPVLYLAHVRSLLLLQGASLQFIVGQRYFIKRFSLAHEYEPRRYLRDLVLVEPGAGCLDDGTAAFLSVAFR